MDNVIIIHHPNDIINIILINCNGISPNIHSNKKQVSFHKEDELLTFNTDKEAIAVSQRSIESFASSTEGTSSSVDPSPNSSMRSYDSSGRTTVSIPSLHSSLTRTLKHRDPLRYYEILKVLGDGSMGSVSKVKKRKSAIGGSARQKFVEEESMHSVSDMNGPLKMFQKCFIFCFPGSKESTKQNAVDAMDEEDEEQHKLSGGSRGSSAGGASAISALTGDSLSRYETSTDSNGKESTTLTEQEPTTSERVKRQQKYRKNQGRSTSTMISYGEVNVVYALKSIILDRVTDPTFRKELMNEIAILRTVDHPNIVKAMEVYDYHHRLYLVLELCSGGDLYARDPYDETEAKGITYMVLDAIAYLHSKGIVHRDCKYIDGEG